MNPWIKMRAPLFWLAQHAAQSYIVGPKIQDAIRACRHLKGSGISSTLCFWDGADENPRQIADEHLKALDSMRRENINWYISIKAPPLNYAEDLLDEIMERTKRDGIRLHFDSLGLESADPTFRYIKSAAASHSHLGCTLPGRWVRSLADAEKAVDLGLYVRVVKGQWEDPQNPLIDLRASFLEVIERLAGRARHVAVATHDSTLAQEAVSMLQHSGTPCELELLFGLPVRQMFPVAQQANVAVRFYLPYGYAWLPYALNKMRGNPRILWWICRDALARRSLRLPRSLPG